MRHFLWKIAGADYKILEKAGKDSQYSFWLIGLLYLIVIIITFIGFLGLFWGVFDNIIPTVVGTSVLGFLVTTIYRLSLISLEPNTLPVIVEKKSLVLTYFVRYFILILFAFFVSKTFEMIIVNFIEKIGFLNYDGSSGYMRHLIEVNTTQPWIWMITVFVIILFITPIYLRHRLNRANQYYLLRRVSDKELVKQEHQKFIQTKEEILKQVYQQYSNLANSFFEHKNGLFYNQSVSEEINKIKSQLKSKTFVSHPKKFIDEPFNTKRIVTKRILKKSDDFLDSILSQ
jgi:hypothetical protein